MVLGINYYLLMLALIVLFVEGKKALYGPGILRQHLNLEQKLCATGARWLEDERKRKPQEMNIKNRGNGQCSIAAEKNQIRGDRDIAHNRHRISRFKKLFRM